MSKIQRAWSSEFIKMTCSSESYLHASDPKLNEGTQHLPPGHFISSTRDGNLYEKTVVVRLKVKVVSFRIPSYTWRYFTVI